MMTSEFLDKMRERMWKIEGTFAEAKQFHCLSCAKYRRLGKVQSQAYMCATALNIKRLVAFIFSIFLVWLSQFIKHQISWLHKNISNLRVFS